MADSGLVVMPQLGESIVDVTLVKWRVASGDAVERGQILAEVETDKATNEIPAPNAGVIGELLLAEGQTVLVGTPILRYDGSMEAGSKEAPSGQPGSSPTSAGQIPPDPLDQQPPRSRLAARPGARGGPAPFASPAVRRLARQHDVTLRDVSGSGRAGRITQKDVLDASEVVPVPAAAPAKPAPTRTPLVYRVPRPQVQPGDQVQPFSRRRRAIAEHMAYSLETSAHVASIAEIDLFCVLRAKDEDRSTAERHGVKLSLTAYLVAALARALNDYPELNAQVLEDQLILKAERNIGVAVDTKEGLIVPVIRRADELGILGIARALQERTERARSGRSTPEDLTGGTFSLSNPGPEGNLFGISIIRQPEVGILRVGEIVKRPVVRTVSGEDVIVIRPMMTAALSYDHRVIDGRTGNAFLRAVKNLLETTEPSLETQRPSRRS